MSAILVRSQQVLTHIGSIGTREKFIRLEEGRLQGAMTRVDLTAEQYEEMGRPSEITVTVEPGDKLNP